MLSPVFITYLISPSTGKSGDLPKALELGRGCRSLEVPPSLPSEQGSFLGLNLLLPALPLCPGSGGGVGAEVCTLQNPGSSTISFQGLRPSQPRDLVTALKHTALNGTSSPTPACRPPPSSYFQQDWHLSSNVISLLLPSPPGREQDAAEPTKLLMGRWRGVGVEEAAVGSAWWR